MLKKGKWAYFDGYPWQTSWNNAKNNGRTKTFRFSFFTRWSQELCCKNVETYWNWNACFNLKQYHELSRGGHRMKGHACMPIAFRKCIISGVWWWRRFSYGPLNFEDFVCRKMWCQNKHWAQLWFLTFSLIQLGVTMQSLCGYPLVKVPVEKICSFAPILLRFDYFRHNIWRLFFAQFHFWYIFRDLYSVHGYMQKNFF